ncbi:hypothetical protein ABHI18_012702 [Aspergillus niger]
MHPSLRRDHISKPTGGAIWRYDMQIFGLSEGFGVKKFVSKARQRVSRLIATTSTTSPAPQE